MEDKSPASKAVMLTIAGSDSSAGAGIQADLKTGIALGAYPLTVLSCATAQVPGQVVGIAPMEANFVASQLEICLKHFPVRAIKTGMLYSPAIIEAAAEIILQNAPTAPLIIDPVMIATAGQSLMQHEALAVYKEKLFPLATLLTPNMDELRALTSEENIHTPEQMRQAAQQLAARYNCAILAKGGHLEGNTCEDILVEADGTSHSWQHQRIQDVSTHGTGCTLSAAITALVAQGKSLPEAVEGGLSYVQAAIKATYRWQHPCAMQALATMI